MPWWTRLVGLYALLPLGVVNRVVALTKEVFTTNAVCTQNNCINPIFPGLEDLYLLEVPDGKGAKKFDHSFLVKYL